MNKYRYRDIRNVLLHELICIWISFFIVSNKWFWCSKNIIEDYLTYNFAIIGLCFAIYSLTIPKLIDIKNKQKLPSQPFKIVFEEMKFSKYKLFVCFILGFLMTLILKYLENCHYDDYSCIVAFSILLASISINFEILFDAANSIFLITELDTENSN